MIDPFNATMLALALGAIVGVAHSLLTRRDRNKYRYEWFCHYGCTLDPVNTTWIARNAEHNDRQRKLDASQNVMTRLL